MKKKVIILGCLILCLFCSCSTKGVEFSLVGKWEIDTVEYDTQPANLDRVEGTLDITINDLYVLKTTYIYDDKSEVSSTTKGSLKACYINKLIQLFPDTSGADTINYSYTIQWSRLILENDDVKIKFNKLQ